MFKPFVRELKLLGPLFQEGSRTLKGFSFHIPHATLLGWAERQRC